MPNWCSNIITIRGTPDALQSFTATINNVNSRGQKYLTFSQTIPRPVDAEDWYTWNCNHWGTKWDIDDDQELEIKLDSILLTVRTAWAPPIAWASTVVNKYPGLFVELAYCELGSGYYGIFKGDNKKINEEESRLNDDDYSIDEASGVITPQGTFAKFITTYGFEDYGG